MMTTSSIGAHAHKDNHGGATLNPKPYLACDTTMDSSLVTLTQTQTRKHF